MDILLNYEYRQADVEPLPLRQLAEHTLRAEEVPDTTEVSITFVDDEEMAALNAEYRGKQGPTDVLSFECDGLDDDFAWPEAEDEPFQLGDIVIAPDVAQRQAADFGTTFEGELTLLVVHGLLHLCGYDHVEDDEAEQMKQRESAILRAWGDQRGDDSAVETLILQGHPFHGRQED